MLSRIAEAVFWIGRYVERADQTARILDVSLQSITEDATHDVGTACKDVYSIFGASVEDTSDLTVQRILDRLVTDRQNPSSIAGALQTARENARGAREVLSTEGSLNARNGQGGTAPSAVAAQLVEFERQLAQIKDWAK